MQDDSSRNTIIFLVCALVLFIIYQTFVLQPAAKRRQAELAQARPAAAPPWPRGRVSAKGARPAPLSLPQSRETGARNPPPVELLRPEGASHAYFAEFGWTGANVPGLPTVATLWTLAQGSVLAPG